MARAFGAQNNRTQLTVLAQRTPDGNQLGQGIGPDGIVPLRTGQDDLDDIALALDANCWHDMAPHQ